jgi:hypothetical protein
MSRASTRLDPEILKILIRKTGKSKKTIRNALSSLHQQYSSLNMNQLAQMYALKNGTSIRAKLTSEEKATFPNVQTQKPITISQKVTKKDKRKQIKHLIKYESSDRFIQAHIDEINRCYTYRCYTAAFILCRKLIENLLTDLIRTKYPQNNLQNIELYFDTSKRRTRDFSEIIQKLRKRSNDFGPDKKLLERALNKSEEFKDDANDKAHSWFHIVKSPRELDDKDIQGIVDMIDKLQANI